MTPEEIRQLVLDILKEQSFSSFNVPFHKHTLTDAGQLNAREAILNSPQDKLTTASGGSLTTGGGNMATADANILTNAILRLGQLETKLTTLGFLKP